MEVISKSNHRHSIYGKTTHRFMRSSLKPAKETNEGKTEKNKVIMVLAATLCNKDDFFRV